MAKTKYTWTVQPAPRDAFVRMHVRRGWPIASYKDAGKRMAAQIQCINEYSPSAAKLGRHKPLFLLYTDYSFSCGGALRRADGTFATLTLAKAEFARIIAEHPEIIPEELRA